jgi:hypothetical protein
VSLRTPKGEEFKVLTSELVENVLWPLHLGFLEQADVTVGVCGDNVTLIRHDVKIGAYEPNNVITSPVVATAVKLKPFAALVYLGKN